ncbi:MAG TPA: response regulator, partial [Geobacteraceae bacterium]|nr:response regulator [Geobacteraceae bacterium]
MNQRMARILCVDDEPLNLSLLEAVLSPRGYDVVSAVNGPKALKKIAAERIDICLLDVMMPGMDGFEVCRRIKSDDLHRNIPVVMITSYADTENRIRGIEAGADDFISKPFDCAEVLARIKMLLHVKSLNEELQNAHDKLESIVHERTGELTSANAQLLQEIDERKGAEESLHGAFAEIKQLQDRLQAENVYLQREVAREYNFGEIIGQSNAISYVFFRVEQVAPQDATVLLLGETGTGKGVIARAIHSSSARKDRPMITVNCTALPANLIES